MTFSGLAGSDGEDMLAKELRGHTDHLAGRHLLLNFAHVRSICSAEVGTLLGLHNRLEAAGGRLTLFGVGAEVYEALVTLPLPPRLEMCRAGDAEDTFLLPRPRA